MRRLAPRPLAAALAGALEGAEPATALARAQAVWADVAGPGLAPFARPAAERDGVLTLVCESGVWAQELELLGPDLLARLREATGAGAGIDRLRFVVGSGAN